MAMESLAPLFVASQDSAAESKRGGVLDAIYRGGVRSGIAAG